MKSKILDEIRRLAEAAGGQVPGARQFGNVTGIRESMWRGVYWARWSEAVAAAGLAPNPTSAERRIADVVLLEHLAKACREFGRVPTVAELRLHRRSNPAFPDFKTIERRFGGFKQIGAHVREWAAQHDAYSDVADLLGGTVVLGKDLHASAKADGSVYLIQSGGFFKIGRSAELERRVKAIRVALPDAAELVHAIQTDDPSGIEAYWHRRFADRRANGEWFKLDRADIAAFKRRRFQ